MTADQQHSEKPKLGISQCLLGDKVRYDGGHKLNHYLHDILGQYVEWVPVCPEVECGLPVPRESMHLEGNPENPRLITTRTGIDHTEKMLEWTIKKLKNLEKETLCGFIFKTKSPSSGMRDIKIYSDKSMTVKMGRGIFAGAFMNQFPMIPVEDEGRLNDPGLRENFIERIFVFFHWKKMTKIKSVNNLIRFHTDHKLLLMAHSPQDLKDMGKIVANINKNNQEDLFNRYLTILLTAMKKIATIKKNVNVLHHIMGYFKKILSGDEKQELLDVIEQYHKNQVPLIVPVTLLNHYVRKYDEHYLKRQYYLHPHPLELLLRNHV